MTTIPDPPSPPAPAPGFPPPPPPPPPPASPTDFNFTSSYHTLKLDDTTTIADPSVILWNPAFIYELSIEVVVDDNMVKISDDFEITWHSDETTFILNQIENPKTKYYSSSELKTIKNNTRIKFILHEETIPWKTYHAVKIRRIRDGIVSDYYRPSNYTVMNEITPSDQIGANNHYKIDSNKIFSHQVLQVDEVYNDGIKIAMSDHFKYNNITGSLYRIITNVALGTTYKYTNSGRKTDGTDIETIGLLSNSIFIEAFDAENNDYDKVSTTVGWFDKYVGNIGNPSTNYPYYSTFISTSRTIRDRDISNKTSHYLMCGGFTLPPTSSDDLDLGNPGKISVNHGVSQYPEQQSPDYNKNPPERGILSMNRKGERFNGGSSNNTVSLYYDVPTTEWFINVENELAYGSPSSVRGTLEGGYTGFARIVGNQGLRLVDILSSAPTYDTSEYYNDAALNYLPLWNTNNNMIVYPQDFLKTSVIPVLSHEQIMAFTINAEKVTYNGQEVDIIDVSVEQDKWSLNDQTPNDHDQYPVLDIKITDRAKEIMSQDKNLPSLTSKVTVTAFSLLDSDNSLSASQTFNVTLQNKYDHTIPEGSATIVKFETNAPVPDPNFYVELTSNTPVTNENFLSYIERGDYDNSIFHRSISDFVIQAGGYKAPTVAADQSDSNPTPIVGAGTSNRSIRNEPYNSNTFGTIAMAKLGGQPDSATSQFFFNLIDNSNPLDSDSGGYTVFGNVLGNGMAIINMLASFPTYDAEAYYSNSALIDLPLYKLDGDNIVKPDDFLKIKRIIVTQITDSNITSTIDLMSYSTNSDIYDIRGSGELHSSNSDIYDIRGSGELHSSKENIYDLRGSGNLYTT